jgi:hypothetical protein
MTDSIDADDWQGPVRLRIDYYHTERPWISEEVYETQKEAAIAARRHFKSDRRHGSHGPGRERLVPPRLRNRAHTRWRIGYQMVTPDERPLIVYAVIRRGA